MSSRPIVKFKIHFEADLHCGQCRIILNFTLLDSLDYLYLGYLL